jgi:hypothetical protein
MESVARIAPGSLRLRPARQGSAAAGGEKTATAIAPPSTALITTGRSEPLSLRPRRISATFLAQLIATKAQVPQARARRRAEPEEASAAYGHVAATRAAAPGLCCAVRA